MALGYVLVDRAKTVTNEPSNYQVSGTTVLVPVVGPVFRCRLTLPQAAEAADGSADGRDRVALAPTLLYGLRDSEGNLLDLNTDTRVLVTMKGVGIEHEYIVATEPEPLRKRVRSIGWYCSLSRVENHERRDIAPAAIRQPIGASLTLDYAQAAHD